MNKKYLDHYLFPAVFRKCGNAYSVVFPDLPGCVATGETAEESLRLAREAAALHIWGMEDDGDDVPKASPIDAIHCDKGQSVCYLDIDMLPIRVKMDQRMVKKTLTIPFSLNELGERHRLNFSKILREGVEEKLRALES